MKIHQGGNYGEHTSDSGYLTVGTCSDVKVLEKSARLSTKPLQC